MGEGPPAAQWPATGHVLSNPLSLPRALISRRSCRGRAVATPGMTRKIQVQVFIMMQLTSKVGADG